MIYPSIDKILQTVDSKYILIQVASQRSKQMNETGHLQMKEEEYICKRGIGRALEEIDKGLIKIKIDDEEQ